MESNNHPTADERFFFDANGYLILENFLSDIPKGLDQIFSMLGQDDLGTYRTRAIQGSVQSIQTFLGS